MKFALQCIYNGFQNVSFTGNKTETCMANIMQGQKLILIKKTEH